MRPILPLAVILLLALPATLQARLIVVTSGSTITHVGDPAPDSVENASALSVGFHHDSFSLFWIDFWTWDGGYCLYGGRMQPRQIASEQAALLLGKTPHELTVPFAYRYPPGLLGVAALLLVGLPLVLIGRILRSSRLRIPGLATVPLI